MSDNTKICFIHENIQEDKKNVIRDKVCKKLAADSQFNGHNYCILHLPDLNKDRIAFNKAVDQKRKDELYDFVAVYFPDYVDFLNAVFTKEVDFRSATFTKNVTFSGATFVEEVRFGWAVFQADTFFDQVTFKKKVSFNSAVFGKDSDMNFRGTKFEMTADFSYATFAGFIEFGRIDPKHQLKKVDKNDSQNLKSQSIKNKTEDNQNIKAKTKEKPEKIYDTEFKVDLNLEHIRLESPNKLKFHSVRLRPYWFINTEATKFIFINCDWEQINGEHVNDVTEFEDFKKRVDQSGNTTKIEVTDEELYKLLSKTFWQIADNLEENKNFRKASWFRKFAQEAIRKKDFKGFKVWSWQWWYWLSSDYGESPIRATMILAGLLLIFTFAFMLPEFQIYDMGVPLSNATSKPGYLCFTQAGLQSLATATFQNIEHLKPKTLSGTFLTIIEKVIVPLQAALLALAIRRKFMR